MLSVILYVYSAQAGRREVPLNQLTPEMLNKPKRIHVLFFTEPVEKSVTVRLDRSEMTIEIHYIQPKSFINKLIRTIADIDKNKKINGFESDRIYDYFHQEMTKNAILQLNGANLDCKTASQKIPDLYGPVDSRVFEYYEQLKCNIKDILKPGRTNLLFMSDYVKLPAKQDRFERPVKVKVLIPAGWKLQKGMGNFKSVRKGKWTVIEGIRLDRNRTAEIRFIPR